MIIGDHTHTTHVDMWSLGVLLYYITTFTYPFFGTQYTVMEKILKGKYAPIKSKEEGGMYSKELVDLIDGLLVVVCDIFF
jgi:serine/threonine protein kinase